MTTKSSLGYLLSSLLLIGLCHCKDQEPIPVRSFTYALDTTTLTFSPADSGAYRDTAFIATYSLSGDQALKERGLSPTAIKDAQLDSATLITTEAVGFSWLDSLALSFSAPSLGRNVVAKRGTITTDSISRLTLSGGSINLARYIQATEYQLLLAAKHQTNTTDSLRASLLLSFTFRYEDK